MGRIASPWSRGLEIAVHIGGQRPHHPAKVSNYFQLEPEVAGGLGSDSILDTSVHPPIVSKLHYEFDGPPADDLLETSPCYIVTHRLAVAIQSSGVTGFEFADLTVSMSEQYVDLYGDDELPHFRWLKPVGSAGIDDVGYADRRLVVSERALAVFRECTFSNCDVLPWTKPL